MKKVVVVGSGASGVHFAWTLLQKGYHVQMVDVGREKPPPVAPDASFDDLKRVLPEAADYFLGRQGQAVILPDHEAEYYGFPPAKQYIFDRPRPEKMQSHGFAPLLSFARGGLAEAWTGGVYPFNSSELRGFPFGYEELAPCYEEVARRIGINGADDDLARFYPLQTGLLPPLDLDEHAGRLLAAYRRQKRYLNESLGCYLGRSRLAVLSQERDGRKPCTYLGRCLWGCPNEALYTPSVTLRECQKHPGFEYLPGYYVSHFQWDEGRVKTLVCESIDPAERRELPVETLALAAGTLMSSRIFLESFRPTSGQSPRLEGLMDNRQIMVPFVNLRMLGRPCNHDTYQYHQLTMGLEADDPKDYVHCQITTLKTAMIHPLVQTSPFDLRTSLFLFRHLRAALGLVNVNLADTRRSENGVTLDIDPVTGRSRLVATYAAPREERRRLKQVIGRVKGVLWRLGCVVPPGTIHVRPMGASVHYAGTIPMSATARPLTASRDCRSHDFPNLFFVDGTTFPFLPAKNLTFTLMANAIRVAERAF